MSNKQELVKRINQKKEKSNDLYAQFQADSTKEHLFHPKLWDFCKEMFVSEAPLDVAVLERNLKNMENILQDT